MSKEKNDIYVYKEHFSVIGALNGPIAGDIILLQNHCNSLIINDLAERVGFEHGLFPTVLHKKEIAENPCKHWYLSTSRLSPVLKLHSV